MNISCVLLLLLIKSLIKADEEYISGFESGSGFDSSFDGAEEQDNHDRVIPKVSQTFSNPRTATSGIDKEELGSSVWVPLSDEHLSATIKSKSTVDGLPIKEALSLMTGLKTAKTDEEFSAKLKTGPEHLGVAFKTFEKLSGLWISIMRRIWKVWKGKGARDVMHSIAHSLLSRAGSAVHRKMGNIIDSPIRSDPPDPSQEISGSGIFGEQNSDSNNDQEDHISHKKEVRLNLPLDDTEKESTSQPSGRDLSSEFLRGTLNETRTLNETNNINEWIGMVNGNKKDGASHFATHEKPAVISKQEFQKDRSKMKSQGENKNHASVKQSTPEWNRNHLNTRNIEIDLGDEDISSGTSRIKKKISEGRSHANSQVKLLEGNPSKMGIHPELREVIDANRNYDVSTDSMKGDQKKDPINPHAKTFSGKTTSQPHQHTQGHFPSKGYPGQNTDKHTNRSSATETLKGKNTSRINERFSLDATKHGSTHQGLPIHPISSITDASSKTVSSKHKNATTSREQSVSDDEKGVSTNILIKVRETNDILKHPLAAEIRTTTEDFMGGSKMFAAQSNTKETSFGTSQKGIPEISHRTYHEGKVVPRHKKVLHTYNAPKARERDDSHKPQQHFSMNGRNKSNTTGTSGSKEAKDNPVRDVTTKGKDIFKKPLDSFNEETSEKAIKKEPRTHQDATEEVPRTRDSKLSFTHEKVMDESMKEMANKDEGHQDIRVDFDISSKENSEDQSHALTNHDTKLTVDTPQELHHHKTLLTGESTKKIVKGTDVQSNSYRTKASAYDKKSGNLRTSQPDSSSAPKESQMHSSVSRGKKATFRRLLDHENALKVKPPITHLGRANQYKRLRINNVESKQRKTTKIHASVSLRGTSDQENVRGLPPVHQDNKDGLSAANNSKKVKSSTESPSREHERSKIAQDKFRRRPSNGLASKVKHTFKHGSLDKVSKESVSKIDINAGYFRGHPKVPVSGRTASRAENRNQKENRTHHVPRGNPSSKRADIEGRPMAEEDHSFNVPWRKTQDEFKRRKMDRIEIHKIGHGDSYKPNAESSSQQIRHMSLLDDGIEDKDKHLLTMEGKEPQVDLLTSRVPPNSLMTTSSDEHIYQIKDLLEDKRAAILRDPSDIALKKLDQPENVNALQEKVAKLESEVTVLEAAMANLAKRIQAQEVKPASSIQSSHRVTASTTSTEELATTHSTQHSSKTAEIQPFETTSAKQIAGQHGMILIPLASLYNSGELKHGLAAERVKDMGDEPRISYTTGSSSRTNPEQALVNEEQTVGTPLLTTALQGPDDQHKKGPVPRPIVNIIMPRNQDYYYGKEFCVAQCQNGGKCVRGNKCACPTFFVGPQCRKFSLSALFGTSKHLGSPYGGVQALASTEPLSDVRSALDKTFRIIGENKADDGIKEDLLLEHGNEMRLAKEAGFESEDGGAENRRLLIEE